MAVLGCTLLGPSSLVAKTFYVDPKNGSAGGDGSKSNPWKTFKQVVDDGLIETRDWDNHPHNSSRTLVPKNQGAPVGPGDTILLESGYHGAVEIQGAYNKKDITVKAAMGATPKLSRLLLRAAENWVIDGLTISPSFAQSYERRTMIDVDNHDWRGPSRNLTIKNCELYSVDDATSWSKNDWDSKAANGIGVDGTNVKVVDNTIRNSNFGISVGGDKAWVARNTVDGFSGDGLRGLGDNDVFEYNVVKNAYDVNKNHDDGFQSWSYANGNVGDGVVKGMVLRGNLIINHEDPSHPMRTSLQGIGCFDGMFADWTVENNVIITDHWHGITLSGARDSKIVNNTVIDLNESKPGPPWIKVGKHKDGTPSENVIIRNNLATSIQAGQGVTADHNIEVKDYKKHFKAPGNFDLHLLKTSAAVDAGSSMGAPMADRDRVPRPQGMGIDIGAYEWHDGSAMPRDTGTNPMADVMADIAGDLGGNPGDDASGVDPMADSYSPTGDHDIGGSTGADSSGGAGESTGGSEKEGCGCTSSPGGVPGSPIVLLLIVFAAGRRGARTSTGTP